MEGGQRLPHRASSTDCEKRFFYFFALPSEEPSDRRGILSLSPLGLEEATEGYFLRSEAKKGGSRESRGKEARERTEVDIGEFESFCWI